VHLFLALLHGVTLQAGYMQPQRFMEKLCFHPALLELHDLPSFNAAKSCPPKKPKSGAKRRKKSARALWRRLTPEDDG